MSERTDFDDPQNEKEAHQCNVCECEIESEGICNKRSCFEADNR